MENPYINEKAMFPLLEENSEENPARENIWSMLVPASYSRTLEERAEATEHPHKILTEKDYQENFGLSIIENGIGKGEVKAELGPYSPKRMESAYISTMSKDEWQRMCDTDVVDSKLVIIANAIGYKMHELRTDGKPGMLKYAEPDELLRSIIEGVGSNYTGDNYKLRVDVLVQDNRFMLAVSDNSSEERRLERFADVSALKGNSNIHYFDHAQFIPDGGSGILLYSKKLDQTFPIKTPKPKREAEYN